jgi:hypothetical protein
MTPDTPSSFQPPAHEVAALLQLSNRQRLRERERRERAIREAVRRSGLET